VNFTGGKMKNKGLKMKRYSLFKEGYNNLHEPTLTNVIGNLTLKEAEIIKRVLEQETSNVYKMEDDSELDLKDYLGEKVILSKSPHILLNLLKATLIWVFALTIIWLFYPLIRFWFENFMR